MMIAAKPHHLQMGIGRVVAKMMDLGLWVVTCLARQRLELSARQRPAGAIPHPVLQSVEISSRPPGPATRGLAGAVLAGSAEAAPHVVLTAMVL
jgi:hypothetical protein